MAWLDLVGGTGRVAEFLLHKFIVIELVIGQAESLGFSAVGPAGLFIRPALRASPSMARDFGAAGGASFRWHRRRVSGVAGWVA